MEPPAVREMFKGMMTLDGEEIPVAEVVDRTVPGPAGDIPVRVYTPEGEGPFPILVWYHGGGWVIGDLDTDRQRGPPAVHARRGARGVRRLPPRARAPVPAPAPTTAGPRSTWVAEHGAELGGDPSRLAIGGDSAGGNLSARRRSAPRREGGPAIAPAAARVPRCDLTLSYPVDRGERGGLLPDQGRSMEWFVGHYLSSGVDAEDPRRVAADRVRRRAGEGGARPT